MASNNSKAETSKKNSTEIMTDDMLKKTLFENVMERNWKEVERIYREDLRSHKMMITSSGNTALHVAASDTLKEVVKSLVGIIRSEYSTAGGGGGSSGLKGVLGFQNEKGHTPLHLAAATGSKKLCRHIVSVDGSLVLVKDNKGETPLFKAVRYGRKKVFAYLHSCIYGCRGGGHLENSNSNSYCWRYDGRTILHSES